MTHESPVQRAFRFIVAATLVVAGGLAYRSHDFSISAQADGKITHNASGNTETWRIDEPNVKQRVTEYRQIRFQPGDRIVIDAGGCVQTGGYGDTWKRYVNPSGPDADKLYHGLIWIPGVVGGPAATGVGADPKRLVAYLGPNQAVTVPSNVDASQLFLRLGYEDDGYGDNGYYSHDDGTQNQCRNVGNAYVVLSITHGPARPVTTDPAPFDLVWTDEDDNGIPLNAKWGWQLTHPGAFPAPTQCDNGPFRSPCTNWYDVVTEDTADICKAEADDPFKDNSPPLYGVSGHVNWAAGTYVGRLTWETHSAPGTDDDYNFDLFPAGGAGLTSIRDNIEVEFDSDETIDHFNAPWWNTLHTTVDHHSDDEVNQMLFKEADGSVGRYAIVTGLEGLEMCHYGSNELHPAWAIAIRVKDDDPSDEVWAMFVRRAGNEGFCSNNQHVLTDLPGNTYTFRLPWRPGATSVNTTSSTVFYQTLNGGSGPGVQWSPNEGVLVSFTVPPAVIGPLGLVASDIIYGELHLQWPGGREPAPIPGVAPAGRMRTTDLGRTGVVTDVLRERLSGAATERDSPEERIASGLRKLPQAARDQYLASVRKPAATPQANALPRGATARIPSLPRRAARPRHRQYESVPDQARRQQQQRMIEALRKLSAR